MNQFQNKVTESLRRQAKRRLAGIPVQKQEFGEGENDFRLVLDLSRPRFGPGYRIGRDGKLFYTRQHSEKSYRNHLAKEAAKEAAEKAKEAND